MTATATELETVRVGEPILGWRLWRVLPYTTLAGEESYRLSSVGLNGVPKTWPAGERVVATCSDFRSTHEAPWLDHECGVWALRSLGRAERRLKDFRETKTDEGVAAWAVGRVSLWGRVIEHELGWRGQYAYPYSVTVYGPEEIVRVIRDVYAVDVDWAPPLREPEPKPKPADRTAARAELEALCADVAEAARAVREISTELLAPTPTAATVSEWDREHARRKREDPLYCNWKLTDADYIAALGKAIEARDADLASRGEEPEGLARSTDVTRIMSPNFVSENASAVGCHLFGISRFGSGAARRWKIPGRTGAFWTLSDRVPTGKIAAEAVEGREENVLDEPAHPIPPRRVLEAIAAAVDARGAGEVCVRYGEVFEQTGSDSGPVVSYRLGLLRRNGYVRDERPEAGGRLWGLTHAGRAAVS